MFNSQKVEVFDSVDEEQFQEISRNNKPALIRNCSFGSCMKNWTLDYLEDKLKDDSVVVHETTTFGEWGKLDFMKKNFDYVTMPFPDFASELKKPIWIPRPRLYLRSTSRKDRSRGPARIEDDFPALSEDLTPPSFIPYGSSNKLYHSSVLRVSSPYIQIWTHFDLYHNVLCQVVGTKRVILIPPEDTKYLYIEGDKTPINNFGVDGFGEENEDFWRLSLVYPLIKKLTFYKCLLEPGDTLFIPALWWHNVRAVSDEPCCSIGFNIFWKDPDVENKSQYSENDAYGNKNLKPFDYASSNLDKAIEHLEKLPERYKSFYKFMLLKRVKKLFPNGLGKDGAELVFDELSCIPIL